MNRTVSQRRQVKEYLGEDVISRSRLETGVVNGGLICGVNRLLMERCWDKDKDAR